MCDYKSAYEAILNDSRYQKNLDWGEVRPGHPEGTVRAHLAEIEPNLDALRPKLLDEDYWKLKLLIHTHDSFKAESQPGVAITDPKEPRVTGEGIPGTLLRRSRPAGDGPVSR
ncbi:hypothetical protein BH11PLA2_BH11PLA2_21240 [soil metagenome]